MQQVDHALLSPSLGCQKFLRSFHFGTPGARPKVYIQASLHAEEIPGMLVAHHLLPLLQAEQDNGNICGEVIVVPVANPIGLAQRLDHKPMGRFELNSSENFNRHYPDLAKATLPVVQDLLGEDPQANVTVIRKAMSDFLQAWTPTTELQCLRRILLQLAFDADVVLDLHCDCESVLHFYTEESCWPQLEPVARLLGSRAILLARNSGCGPFDECLSGAWWQLAQALKTIGHNAPVPQACCSATIELRGEAEVSHALAQTDARALMASLQHIGAVRCPAPPPLPAPLCHATPLAGSETLTAAVPGLVVFAAEPGQSLEVGDLVAEIIDPIAQQTHRVLAGVAGVFYARIRDRYVCAGGELGKIAGDKPFRTGNLLGV
ncbi:MAG: succinylglutamate desuccinylase/aspartoacylase family protein [Burkholderiales bacterium]